MRLLFLLFTLHVDVFRPSPLWTLLFVCNEYSRRLTLMASTWISSSLDLDLTPPITSDDGDFIKDTVVTAGVKKLQTQRWPPLSSLIEEKVESNSIAKNGTMTTNTATHSSAFQLTGHLDWF
jgi:hypothetical protein